MTTGLITPTKEQEKQFKRFVEDTAESARKQVPLDKGGMQRLLANGDKVRKDFIASLVKHSVADDRFNLLASFEITVPRGYDHATQLATSASYAKEGNFCYYHGYYHGAITDENCAKTTNMLVPGKTYEGKIFGIKECVSSENCLAFLASQRAVLVSAQGLSLVKQLKKNVFPVGKWTVSFDEKDALWEDDCGLHRVPCVFRSSDGSWKFRLFYFGGDWLSNHCLLCLSAT